jgi:hypothetical protein
MRKAPFLMTAIVLIALPMSSSLAAKPPKPPKPTISIAVNHPMVTYGNVETVSGTLSTNATAVSVTLEGLPYPFTAAFQNVTNTPTTTGGNYAFGVTATQSMRFRVNADTKPKATSAVVTMLVRRRVGIKVGDTTPAKRQRVRFSGISKPANVGGTAQIQHHTVSGWKTVATAILKAATTASSTYSVRVRINGSGRYRTYVAGGGGYEPGSSRAVKLTVH